MDYNTIVNRYFSDNERYADLINGCEFGGEQIITAEDLHDCDTQVSASMKDTEERKKPDKRKTKYRDLIRKMAFGVNFMVVGLENQTKVHLIEIPKIQDTTVFQTDLKQVFDFI